MALRLFDNHRSPVEGTVRAPSAYPIQNWQSFAGHVEGDKHLYQWVALAEQLTPFGLLLDMSNADQNDRFILRESIHLDATHPARPGTNEADHDGKYRNWTQTGLSELYMPIDGIMRINEQKHGISKVVLVEILSGPWLGRVEIAQTQGRSCTLRFMVF